MLDTRDVAAIGNPAGAPVLWGQPALSPVIPSEASASDSYTVDFTASTGSRTRWQTGVTEGDVVYPDRATEDAKLLVYTSPPIENDLEITGSPVLTLEMSSTASDGVLHAYPEDVFPDGRVTSGRSESACHPRDCAAL